MLTTISCETFHSKLKAMFYDGRPTFSRLLTDIYTKQRDSNLNNHKIQYGTIFKTTNDRYWN